MGAICGISNIPQATVAAGIIIGMIKDIIKAELNPAYPGWITDIGCLGDGDKIPDEVSGVIWSSLVKVISVTLADLVESNKPNNILALMHWLK